MGKSRAPEHAAFLDWLLKQMSARKVDALIVAGDIFDTGAPPSYAREMYNRFIVDIQSTGCELLVLGGNHDSVATLNESKALLACLNTHVVSGVTRNIDSQIITLKNRQGEAGAIVCAVPFIRARDVMISQAGQSASDKKQVLQQSISEHYHALYKQAVRVQKAHHKTHKKQLPIIATGHLITVGASTSDSVREIYIGTLDAFPASAFPPVDYIALGHIHRSQLVAKSAHIRYSGSPIPLSFDETKGQGEKSVLVVDFKDGAFKKAQALTIPGFQPMQMIKGDLDSIEKQLKDLPNKFELEPSQTIWVEVQVTSQDYLNDLQTRVQTLTENLPVEVLLLRRERNKRQSALYKEEKETLNELSVEDVFERRLAEEDWQGDDQEKRLKRLKSNFKQVVDSLADAHGESA